MMRIWHWLGRVGVAAFPQLGRVPVATVCADALYQADRDLFEAELNAEHWVAHRDMLKRRCARLRAESTANPVQLSINTTFDIRSVKP